MFEAKYDHGGGQGSYLMDSWGAIWDKGAQIVRAFKSLFKGPLREQFCGPLEKVDLECCFEGHFDIRIISEFKLYSKETQQTVVNYQ